MIKINKNDGKTLSFELDSPDELKSVTKLLNENGFVEAVTGISSLHNTFWHALTKPKKFRKVRYFVEHVMQRKGGILKEVGEKIICQADDIQLTILVYYSVRPKMTRIELRKIGRQRFQPTIEVNSGVNNYGDK